MYFIPLKYILNVFLKWCQMRHRLGLWSANWLLWSLMLRKIYSKMRAVSLSLINDINMCCTDSNSSTGLCLVLAFNWVKCDLMLMWCILSWYLFDCSPVTRLHKFSLQQFVDLWKYEDCFISTNTQDFGRLKICICHCGCFHWNHFSSYYIQIFWTSCKSFSETFLS